TFIAMLEKHRETAQYIKQALQDWGAQSVEVADNSHLHVGHEGAKSGGGHFAVTVVASHFAGLNRLKRHRLVHQQVKELWDNGRIHALEVDAQTPEEKQ
ncbi:MAG: BolA family transcriptional regulator, partial [Proteobacteria bacterium]|nr:BolA family transcriptional regulator [Pseudomonadota bacterium]